MMATRITQIQAFMALTQMLMMPLFFLSGALYPLSSLPAWLSVLARLDPITYVVYPMRQAVFSYANPQNKTSLKRATPGGYGGKPPGVAIIGLPTGARKAGSGAPTGDQSTDMNRTRPAPCMCQDLKTVKSRDAFFVTCLPPRRPLSVVNSSACDRPFFGAAY